MTWFFFILFVSLVSITIVIIQQTSSISTNNQKNLKPDEPLSFRDKHSWITDNSQETGRLFYTISRLKHKKPREVNRVDLDCTT